MAGTGCFYFRHSSLTDLFLSCSYFRKFYCQKQPSRGVLRKRCSENMQQIYRTPMPKCDLFKFTRFLRLSQHILYYQRNIKEEKKFLKKKKLLHFSFEVLNKSKRKKEKEVIVFKRCCLRNSG